MAPQDSLYFLNGSAIEVKHDITLQTSRISYDCAKRILHVDRPATRLPLKGSIDVATSRVGITFGCVSFHLVPMPQLDVDVTFGSDWIGICREVYGTGEFSFSPDTWEWRYFSSKGDPRGGSRSSRTPSPSTFHTETVDDIPMDLDPDTGHVGGSSSSRTTSSSTLHTETLDDVQMDLDSDTGPVRRSTAAMNNDDFPDVCPNENDPVQSTTMPALSSSECLARDILISPSSSPLLGSWDDLRQQCTRHGIERAADSMIKELRIMLVRHLFSGDCFLFNLHRPSGVQIDGFRCTCEHLSASFSSPRDLVFELFQALQRASNKELETDRLLLVLGALMPRHPLLSIANLCKDTKFALQHCLSDRLRNVPSVPFYTVTKAHSGTEYELSSLSDILESISSKNKRELKSMAIFHGLQPVPGIKRAELELSILSHLTKGHCVADQDTACEDSVQTGLTSDRPHPVSPPSGCREVRESIQSQVREMPELSDVQMRLLESISKTVNLNVNRLRTVLYIHGIPYEKKECRSTL
ncbi:hypothetical protein VNI00_018660 [Paramarasmius palmivorus]|uniref:Uncharacterized protein n=1 Tax=Paramarasmius palmivorus TaxID=297713 RepID=A0AAW0AUR4_9AGAR